MSLYGIQAHICEVPCAMVLRGGGNGRYTAVFERERASLEEIEAIDWARPVISGNCLLPVGYGFTVEDISYSAGTRSYTVSLKVAEQFLGDVAGFQAQVDELTASAAAAQAETESVRQELREQETALAAAYQEGVERNG